MVGEERWVQVQSRLGALQRQVQRQVQPLPKSLQCDMEFQAECIWMSRDVLSKLAMAKNWKPLVSSSNPTCGTLVVWPGISPEQSW